MPTQSSIAVTPGAGANVDTTTTTGGNRRQIISVGDSTIDANYAPVQSTDPIAGTAGMVVRDINTSAIVARLGTTIFIQLDPGHTLGIVDSITKTVAVYFDRGNPTVTANVGTGSMAVYFDRGNPTVTSNAGSGTFNIFIPDTGHTLGNIGTVTTVTGITNTVLVFHPDTGHTIGKVDAGTGTFQIFLPDTGHEIGTIRGNTNTLTVFLPDTGHEIGTIRGNTNTLTVFLPDTGHELGSVRGITNSINVYLGATAGTVTVKIDPAGIALVNAFHTASIFTTSGSYTGNSTAGVTVISPSANASFKVFAFSLTTTAQSNIFAKFTNGAASGPTEYWRVALQAPAQGVMGANLAVSAPSYLWATGVSTTLSLVLDSASLVHYSVAYIKESA